MNYHNGIPKTNETATPKVTDVLSQNINLDKNCGKGTIQGLEESHFENVIFDNVVYGKGYGTCEYSEGVCKGDTKPCPDCFKK